MRNSFAAVVLALTLSAVPAALAQTKAEPPVPVRTIAPEYPHEMRRDGVSGIVTVRCTVDEKGDVVDPVVEKSTNREFEEPALSALKKWKFKPARQDGNPVAIKVSIPVKFSVES
jgi:protein TonB